MHPTIVCGLDQGLTMLVPDLKGPASTFVRNTFLLFICHSVCGIFPKTKLRQQLRVFAFGTSWSLAISIALFLSESVCHVRYTKSGVTEV